MHGVDSIADGVDAAPIVSIVMPVHNQGRVLSGTFRSLRAQTLDNYELICVDDGSTDSSISIEKSFSEADARIKLLLRDQEGAALARNYGLAKAEGKYVIFLDSDDLFRPDMLERMVSVLEQSGADLCICEWCVFDCLTGGPIQIRRLDPKCGTGLCEKHALGRHLFQFSGQAWNKMYRRDFLLLSGALFQDTKNYNDTFFTTMTMWDARTVYLLREPLVLYRRGLGTSIQDRRFEHPYEALLVAEEIYDRLRDAGPFSPDEWHSLLQRCAGFLVTAVSNVLAAGKYDEAFHQRVVRDLGIWGIRNINLAEIGPKPLALRLWLLLHADWDGVVWAHSNWDVTQGRKRSLLEKASYGARIVAASLAGLLKEAAGSHKKDADSPLRDRDK